MLFVSYGQIGNAPTELTGLGWSPGDLPSTSACRASAQSRSVTSKTTVINALKDLPVLSMG